MEQKCYALDWWEEVWVSLYVVLRRLGYVCG